MATKPDAFPALAMKRAVSRDAIELFSQLVERAARLAKLQDEFLETVIQHREARTGKKFNYTKRQEKFIAGFDDDGAKAAQEVEKQVQKMDDVSLLASAVSSEQMQVNFDEKMFSSYRSEDQAKAKEIIAFRRQTMSLIENIIQQSPLKEKIESQLNMIGYVRK